MYLSKNQDLKKPVKLASVGAGRRNNDPAKPNTPILNALPAFVELFSNIPQANAEAPIA